MYTSWSDDRVADLKRFRDAGLSRRKIAEKLGVTKKSIDAKILRINLPVRPRSNMWPPESIEQLRKLIDDGLSASQIAREMGVTKNAVIGKAHRNGIKLKQLKGENFSISHQEHRLRAQRNGGAVLAKLKARVRSECEKQLLTGISTHAYGAVIARAKAFGELPADELVTIIPEQTERPLVAILELQRHQCRWPVGDVGTPGFGFCGGYVCMNQEGNTSSYCVEHHRRAYKPL